MTAKEIDALIGERDYVPFLNPRNELYRSRKMKLKPPSRSEAIRLMAKEPNLIRRPVIIHGDRILLGFDEEAIRGL
jgi:arsenate reductase-like glutaredoxin family protein